MPFPDAVMAGLKGENLKMLNTSRAELSISEAIIALMAVLFILSGGIIYLELAPHLPMTLSIIVLIIFGMYKKIAVDDLQKGIINGASSGLGAVYIFFFIGMLISSWMASGTIPTLLYGGFQLFADVPLYFSIFLVCSVVGVCIGSAFTTSASIGVAFLGMAAAMDASLAIAAGAIVSGAYLGDKMSPLSDTTNLASETVGVPLFEHIKNMMWTTIPGFVIAGFLYYILSPASAGKSAETLAFIQALQENTFISWTALIPFAIVVVLAILRVSTLLTLSAGIVSGVVLAFIADSSMTFTAISDILFSGYVLDSNVEQLNAILSRGGIESMMFSISLVLLALGMGGLLFTTGIIPAILKAIESSLKNLFSLTMATAFTAMGINFFVGEQYLSILLTGKSLESQYKKLGYKKKNLARAIEDTGTVVNPLVPWGVSGVFLASVLGVPVVEYVPYAFFCLICPLLTIISGVTHIGISKEA